MLMRILIFLLACTFFASCWSTWRKEPLVPTYSVEKVWGNKPIYGSDADAKKITYSTTPRTVSKAGNIYIKDNYIFQVEVGTGIHVIDNSDPTAAKRIGFLTINGSAEISIKGNNLYSNNYDDLVVIDLSTHSNIREIGRVKNAFPNGRVSYPLMRPNESGFYECPRYDSLVVGWIKDSVAKGCYRN